MFDSEKSEEFIKLLKTYNVSVKNSEYSNQFTNYYSDRKKYDEFINNKIYSYIDNKLNTNKEIDLNEIIKNFEYLRSMKLNNVLDKIGIKEIFDLDKTKTDSEKRKIYNNILYNTILNQKRANQNNCNFLNFF